MPKESKIIISPSGAKFDLEQYPIIHYYGSEIDPGLDGAKWMTDTLELLLQESEVKIKLIVDNSPMIESLSAKTRFEVGRRFSLLDDLIKDKVECIAFATGSYLAKVMLSTLMLIKRPQVTYKVFDTTDEALGWVKTF